MEMKRKKIRQSALFLQSEEKCMKVCKKLNGSLHIVEDMNLLYIRQICESLKDSKTQEKLDFEVRMRDGAYKLLMASSKRDQILNASKNLLTCNTRIKAYMADLRSRKEDQDLRDISKTRSSEPAKGRVACKGKVALSGLRVPLMWKDSDHFNNKGSSRRVAVFCLMKIGAEVFDTEMVVVDRSVTDICFEGHTVFAEAQPDFELNMELYSCAMEEDNGLVNTPKKLARRFRTSFGRSSGKKLLSSLEGGDPESFMQHNPIPSDARFSLLAYTTLCLAQAEGSFQSHSLIVIQTAESSSWLPLYGNLCCRLVAQPNCMTQEMRRSFLSQQQNMAGSLRYCNYYCVLKAGWLSCYYSPEEIDSKLEPALVIPINKETRIRVVDKNLKSTSRNIVITNPGETASHIFTSESSEELDEWMEAFWQHFYDQDQWEHCCKELLKIEVPSPRKPPLFLSKRAESVYNDLSISSPDKFESLTDIIHNKIEETDGRFLIGQDKETEHPQWAALFEGSRPIMVQKAIVSPRKDVGQSSSTCVTKKRRAPPPPPGKQPYGPALNTNRTERQKPHKKPGSRTGRPSLDAKFAAIIHQLQKNPVPIRKTAPLGHRGVPPDDEENLTPNHSLKPVPAPRLKQKASHKAW